MKSILTILLTCFVCITASAQHTLSGIVTDKSDPSHLLEGVAIYIPDYNKFDLSKEGGTYILRGIGSGVVNVQYTRIGYRSVVKTVNLKDSATVVNIEMEPTSMELEEVVVTSNSTKLPDHIPYTVNTISLAELQRTGTLNALSALAYQPGIDKISLGNGISKPVIRGLSFNRILLYQNGTRLENQPWDDRHDIGVNENGVEKVEVVKGPAALIYGSDAMGGALIFVDEKPSVSGTTSGDVELAAFTNTLGLNLKAGVKGSSENGFFYGLRLGGESHTSYIQGNGDKVKKNTEEKDFAFNSKYMSTNAKLVTGVSKKWGVSKLTYSYQRQLIGIIEIEDGTSIDVLDEQRDRELEAPYQDVATHVISSENTFTLGKSKVNFNVAFQHNNRKEFEPLNNGVKKAKEEAIALKLNTISYDLKYSSNAEKKFGYTFGTQSFFQTNRNSGLETLVPDADVNDVAGYGLIRYDSGKWNFLAGGRFDYRTLKTENFSGQETVDTNKADVETDRNFSFVNGSIGVAFHPVDELTLKLNAASGFTAPNYAQVGSNGKHEGAYRYEKGNIALDIEQNYQGDLGLIWELRDLSVSANAFYNRINNYIYISNTGVDTIYKGDTLRIYKYAQKDATISGGEFTVDFHPQAISWIDITASYGMLKGEFVSGGNVPYIPSNKFVGGLKFTKAKLDYIYQPYIGILVRNYFNQKNVTDFETITSAYTLLDFNFGGKFKWGKQYFDLSIAATNVLNTGYYSALSLVKNLQPVGIRDMGRNITIRLRVPFAFQKHPKQ